MSVTAAAMAEPDHTSLLKVTHLTMRFGGLVAIDDVSFVARQREITGIIGPNGAGKTTLFNCITGFYKPTVGRLELFRDGKVAYLLEQMEGYAIGQKARVARTFQNIRLFAGNGYADLSETALYYIGGVIKHAKAINAFTNPTTNSYKRLIPGFEAPVLLAYSSRNRSASCRIPYVASPNGKRVEVRFPDPLANPYLAFSALLMAGLDGIQNKIHPGDPMDKNLYDLPPEELADVPTVCGSLREALQSLEADHAFLLKGDVFNKDFIEAYMALKWEEVYALEHTPHPIEYQMYYSS